MANKRTLGRARYTASFEGCLSYCGLCGYLLFWPSKSSPDELYCKQDRFNFWVKTENGLRHARRGTVDHIKKLSDGGDNTLTNLAGLCWPCHEFKDNPPLCRMCFEPMDEMNEGRIHSYCYHSHKRLTCSLGDVFSEVANGR